MGQTNIKSVVMYQGNGSNNVFSIPMVKGFYGTISVAFVRRGKAVYDFNPTTWTINGNLFAWDVGSGSFFYTNTAAPSTGAVAYNEYGVANGYEVASISGTSIEFSKTGSANVSGTRDTTADIDENSVLTWTGDVLNIGDFIVIQRTTILQQPYSFPNNQKHLENSDDNIERQVQELAYKLESVLSIDPTFSIDSTKMTPQEWLETVLRSTDKSIRELKKYNDQLFYSSVDPESSSGDKIWYALPNSENIKTFRRATMTVDGVVYKFVEALDTTTGTWFPVGGSSPVRNGVQSDTIVGIEYDLEEGLIITLHEGETVSIIPFSAELKEIYDAAAEMAHTHDNKEDLDKVSGENTGDETETTIKTKLGITTLSGSNTGDQDLSGYALLSGATFSGQISAPNIIAGNTIYGGTISANLDTITKSGLYTCYGTATGVPSADYSWFVLHQNSNVGTTSATQRAVAYDNTTLRVYERVKTTTWGTWVLQGSGGGGSSILPAGTCSTAGATAAKEVTVAGYTETAGACALITFENKNTALGPNLYIPFTGGTAADPLGVYTLTTIGSPTYTGDKFNSNGTTGLSYNITSLGSGAWCIQDKIMSTNTTTNQLLMASGIHFGFLVSKATDNKLVLNLSGNGTTWSIVGGLSGTKNDWATNTEYYIRVRFSGTAYYVDWSLDGVSWTNEITHTSSTPIYSAIGGLRFGIYYDNSNPLIGTMDDLYVSIGSDTITDYPTLNINGGGAKPILHADGTAISATNPAYFIANCPIQFCYDGTGYRFKQERVNSYVNGINWYNLYNNGWVEQGDLSNTPSGATATKTFLIPMLSNNIAVKHNATGQAVSFINSISTTTIELFTTARSAVNMAFVAGNVYWEVKGFAA